jgi:putative component of membrane protein insertase Oxa1/YidC/SpoIIIJ protein YidD
MKHIFTIILFLLISIINYSQTPEDIDRFKDLNIITEDKSKFEFAQKYDSDIKFLISRLFLFYKMFVSTQDVSSCAFTPSCSEYAMMSIQKQGFIIGTINFFDRFTRCNGLSPELYTINKNTHKLDDPPRNFRYETLY